ncbi:hypothetical protein MXB_822 [Myxobolus squamalis]|nr:hypothetical protein MXB_822 [Myxobolus squamalis]
MTKYYRCMHYESKGCTARLIVSENKIICNRSNETNRSHYEFVEIPLHSLTNLNTPFFKKHIYWDFNKKFHRMLIWTLDEGLAVLRHRGPIFVEGTFLCVPAAFAQCIIIMA